MAILILRNINHVNAAGGEPAGRLKRGEVVDIVDDDHVWGRRERNNPAWEFVSLPNIPRDSLTRLLNKYTESESALIEANLWDGILVVDRRRAYRLHVTRLEALMADPVAAEAFRSAPSWEAAEAAGLILRYDEAEG